MSFLTSLKAMFAAKTPAQTSNEKDACCDHDHGAMKAKADCCADEKCCKDGATCSTDGCDCK
jgi:hypothetical protein